MTDGTNLHSVEPIEGTILEIRGCRVIVDADLARIYGIQTKTLNQAVKRNLGRFPADFMFQLTKEEKEELVTNCDRLEKLKHSTSLPSAFTEHGTIMAANALSSPRAVAMSVYIVRAFVRLRGSLSVSRELGAKLDELEQRLDTHDLDLTIIFDAIRKLTSIRAIPRKRIIGLAKKNV